MSVIRRLVVLVAVAGLGVAINSTPASAKDPCGALAMALDTGITIPPGGWPKVSQQDGHYVITLPSTGSVPCRDVAVRRLRVRGKLVLANARDWHRLESDRCDGDGLYGDVAKGVPVRVRDDGLHVLASSHLRAGRIRSDECRFRFSLRTVWVPTLYRFEVGSPGKPGLIFQDARYPASLERTDGRVTFVIGHPSFPFDD